ncbi:trypsin-like peptidase domain-containing protein [Microcystis aeruginosa LEGE 11464]|jgi:S1-C subfamily serine protease|uniref:trypsin-like peptidase domain-containing protein n=1 Tax=Microcystis aeruginosa TaxID=1126 RepID=UPI00187FD5CE|nr:trypsin-like peptidase domain-containing protein [Microcystis aeruginosa]MBE9090204.1 trypsin-like peptidase domain-containing protein [Microcystis aeruginosa LEGE 11464]
MKRNLTITALILAPALALFQSCSSVQQVTPPNQKQQLVWKTKPAVVRILGICGSDAVWHPYGDKNDPKPFPIDSSFRGTGFFINSNGYIVTSASPQLSIGSEESCKEAIKRNILKKLEHNGVRKPDRELKNVEWEDRIYYVPARVILPNAKVEPPLFAIKKSSESSDVTLIKIPANDVPTLRLGDSKKVQTQDSVITLGFPTDADFKLQVDQALTEESFYEASADEGSISNPYKLRQQGNPVLQVDGIEAGEGTAGSPVINSKGEVIGMLAPKDPESNSNNIVFAIPASLIQETIKQAGTTNESGPTDQLYLDGLELYWKGNIEGAREKFKKAQEIYNDHSEVNRLLKEIAQIEGDRYLKPLSDPFYQLLLALIAGAAGLAAYFLLRPKAPVRKTPSGSPAIPEMGGNSQQAQAMDNGAGNQIWIELECQGQLRRFPLSKEEHRLGRDPDWSDFKVPAGWEVISRHHAILRKQGDDYRIHDGDGTVPSRNGLWVEDEPVGTLNDYPLKDGDQIKIGKNPQEWVILTYFNQSGSQAAVRETRMGQ